MDIVPQDISPVELREEVNSRAHRAGYTTREGKPRAPKVRSVPLTEQGRKNYSRIFKHD